MTISSWVGVQLGMLLGKAVGMAPSVEDGSSVVEAEVGVLLGKTV